MELLKIGFIITNLSGGGAEKAVLKLASTLGERGHDVHLILLENIIAYPLSKTFTLHVLKKGSRGFFGKRLAAYRLKNLIRNLGQFDLIVSTLPYADEITKLAKLPKVWHRISNNLSAEIESLKKSNPKKAKRRLKRYQWLYAKSHLIAVSRGVANDLKELFPHPKLEVIYNFFDPEGIAQLASEEDCDIPKEPYIIHVGRFMPQKRHDILFEALKIAQCKEKLVLLTTPCQELTNLISHYGLNDQVLVYSFKTNPYSWIKHARLLVLCSDREGLPNVLIEALICRTPVVSTDCPSGPSEILRGPLSQFLVPCRDPQALAEAIKSSLAKFDVDDATEIIASITSTVSVQYENLSTLYKES